MTLAWNAAAGTNRLKSASLAYAVSVVTSQGAIGIVAPLADIGSGFRKALSPQRNFSTSHQLRGLAPGTYFWGVQTVYGSLSSPFASGSFVVEAPSARPALTLRPTRRAATYRACTDRATCSPSPCAPEIWASTRSAM